MKISFNAPVTLALTVAAIGAMVLSMLTEGKSTEAFFSTYPEGGVSALSLLRMLTHILGHAGWDHLLANFTLILILGPLLEEKYGSLALAAMIVITAFVTSLFNNLLFSTGLLGASGIVFMMILLSSFSNIKSGQIPVTFIIVVILFLGREVVAAFHQDNISQFAHLAGGISGSIFGFLKKSEPPQEKTLH